MRDMNLLQGVGRDLTGKDGGQNRKVTRGGTCHDPRCWIVLEDDGVSWRTAEMNEEADRGKLTRAYAAHRSYLVDLAFRMLGDIGAAEDVVQDAFSRLMRA